MKKYVVKPGFTFGAQDQFKPGDIVELYEPEAVGFLDKLELYVEPKKKPARKPAAKKPAAKGSKK